MTATTDMETETKAPPRKPRDAEIDVYGLTHIGLVRKTNQDHFLIGSLRKKLDVVASSLPQEDITQDDQRVAFRAMVADGVGGGYKGEEASRIALEEVTQYITESARCYFAADAVEEDFVASLKHAAALCHQRVMDHAADDPDASG